MASVLDAGSVVANFVANTKQFERGVGRASSQLSEFSKKSNKRLEGLGRKFKETGQKMERAGEKMSIFSGAVATGIGVATKAFVGFDDQMRTVEAITGSTTEEMEKLTDKAKELGSTTRFSASESAEAMEMLGRAGFDTNEILEATPGILDLAASSGEDLGQTADTASDILSAFGLEAKEAGRVSDVLAEAAGNSNTSVGQLGEAMKYAAPVANDFGASLEETSAIAGVMADNGIKASNAGTALRAGFQRLSAPTEDAAAVLEELNVQTTNAEGEMRSMTDILFDYKDANEEMTDQQQLANNKTVFGAEASSAFATVLNAGEGDVREFTSALEGAEGSAEDMANTMEGGTGGAFRELRSQIETTTIKLGDLFSPMIEETVIPAISSLNDQIQKLVNWFGKQDEETQNLISSMTIFAVAIGPVLLVLGKLIAIVSSVAGAASTLFGIIKPAALFLGKSLLPLLAKVVAVLGGPLTLAIGAVIAAGVLLITNWETIRDNGITLWRALKRIVIDALIAIASYFEKHYKRAKNIFTDLGNAVVNLINNALEGAKNIFTSGVNFITNQAGRLSRTVQRWFRQLKTGAIHVFNVMWNGVKNIFMNMLNGIKKIVIDLWGTVNHHFKRVKETVSKWIHSAERTVGKVFSEIWSTINHHVNNAWNTVDGIFHDIWGTVNHWVNKVWGTVNHIFQSLTDTVFEKFDSWEGHIRHAIFKIRRFFHNSSKRIQDAITGPFNQAKDWIQQTFAGLNIGDIFGDMIRGLPNGQKILNELPSFASGVRDFAGGAARVNERGGEIRFMPDGTKVIPASLSQNMMNQMPQRTGGVTIESVVINENADADKFFQKLDERQRFVDSGLTE